LIDVEVEGDAVDTLQSPEPEADAAASPAAAADPLSSGDFYDKMSPPPPPPEEAPPPPPAPPGWDYASIKALWERCDKNQDGKVTRLELILALRQAHKP